MSVLMKPSGVEWIGDIPKHWRVERLKDVVYINKDTLAASTDENYLIKYLEISNVNTLGVISEDAIEELSFQDAPSRAKRIINAGDTIVSSVRPNLQAIAYIDLEDDNLICSTGFYTNKVIHEAKHSKKYVYYYLLSEFARQSFISFGKGVGYPAVSDTDYSTLKIVYPSYLEQKAIANFLDKSTFKIDTAIKTKQAQLKTLESLKKSIIYKAVTEGLDDSVVMKDSEIEWIGETPIHWGIKRLFNICDFVRGNSAFGKNELLNKGKYVALQYGKTYKVEEINEQFKFYVNDEFYKSSQIVNYGDTIFVSTSETMEDLGHSVFYTRKDIGLIGGEQILLKPNKNILDGKYLFYSSKVFGKGLKKFATGIKVFRFDIYDLKTIYTPLPPLKEQQYIIDYLDKEVGKIDTLTSNIQKQINKLQEYKKSLIYEYVTGKKQVKE